jgi:uncharacterized protein (DUF58 family)
MLNLLKESSKKSPFRFRFATGPEAEKRARAVEEEGGLKGIRLTIPLTSSHLKLVLEERFFVVAAIIIVLYIFAGETGSEYIYLLTSIAISALALGIFIPLLQVLETNVQFNLPKEAVSKERLNLRVRVVRKNWWGPLARFLPIKWLLVKIKLTRLGEKENMLRSIMVEQLTSEAWVVAQTPKLRRGIYTLQSIELYSCYPFGLAWWVKSYPLNTQFTEERHSQTATYTSIQAADAARTTGSAPQMIVFPRTDSLEGNFLFRLRAAGDSALFFSSSRPIAALTSASVRSLREFRQGDSPRLIHWPTSARTGKLMIREFESEGLPGFDVLLDLTSAWQSEEQFELAVSIALSLLQLGYKLGGSPELFIIPSVDEDIDKLPAILTDLPPLAPGIGWAAQILARVDALTVNNLDYSVKVPRVGETDTLALLTLRPAAINAAAVEAYDDYLAGLKQAGKDESEEESQDRTVMIEPPAPSPKQVDIWVMSRAYLQADADRSAEIANIDDAMALKARIPLHAQGSGDRRQGPAVGSSAPPGRVLATLSEYEEMPHL